ncbi:MAG: Mur ligase family protein [Bdellovibrionota bacterium]
MSELTFNTVVTELEALNIMPKTMPGLDKLKQALQHKTWFQDMPEEKIITVAGTNGKGTTCAALQTLLLSAGKKVGLYTSPHLISTTERIRVDGESITEAEFIELYRENKKLITQYHLTHFESLTLMAADCFFAKNDLDYVLFEVGLGGTYDATNVFPNRYSVITALALDHQNILGDTVLDIAKNKFGIIKAHSKVIHHPLPPEVFALFSEVLSKTNSQAIPAIAGTVTCEKSFEPYWFLQTPWGKTMINLPGQRACENIMTALTVFEELGFEPQDHLHSLEKIPWQGRMQKIKWPHIPAPVYLSGDHNIQGVQSLAHILHYFEWNELHLVVGIGQDKAAEEMLRILLGLPRVKLHLTKTPFKGRSVMDYPEELRVKAVSENDNVIELLNSLTVAKNDLVVVTGSLYLVGQVLSELAHFK